MPKAKKKNEDLEKLKNAIELVDENKRGFALKLFERAIFMEKTLNELENTISSEGAVITSTNGNGFSVMNEHPAQKSYNVMIGKYNALVKTILDMLPDGGGEEDELMAFLGRDKN